MFIKFDLLLFVCAYCFIISASNTYDRHSSYGCDISFWDDNWLGGVPLKQSYSRLYEKSNKKDMTISEMVEGSNPHTWVLGTRNRLPTIESRERDDLLLRLQATVLNNQRDCILWQGKDNGFSVRSTSKIISDARGRLSDSRIPDFLIHKVWVNIVAPRAQFFMWLALKKKTLTDDRLKRIGLQFASVCSLCGQCEENIDHLLVNCSFTETVWAYFAIGTSLNQRRNSAYTLLERLRDWKITTTTPGGQLLLSTLPHAIAWTIWLERNRRRFKNEIMELWKVIQTIKYTVWSWVGGDPAINGFTLEDLMINWSNTILG